MITLFRRNPTPAVRSEPEPARTGIRCTQRGCPSEAAQPCSYRDRRGRSCTAVFCTTHSTMVGGQRYCRRHAGTVTAIGELAADPNGRPDIDNRGPSLVNWISRDLDKNIRKLLEASTHNGEKVIVDQTVVLAHDQDRQARWERSWRIVEATGMVLKVTVHVSEDNDALVHVRVGTEMVADGVPPWIARRREGQEVEASIDTTQRQLFYAFLEENITSAVTRFRARGDKASWGR